MRSIFLSDIHGNLEALEAVVDALPTNQEVVVAGDLCLEGSAPAEVWDRLQDLGWTLVAGNTDRDLLAEPRDLEPKKQAAAAWTTSQLGVDRLAAIAELPFSVKAGPDESALVVHANPLNMEDHLYPTLTDEQLWPYLENVGQDMLVFGHYHVPYTRPVRGKLLVDVSSVGHPKDLDHRAAFTIVEWEGATRAVTQVRVPYDIEGTIAAYRSSGMPDAEKQIRSLLKASY